MPSSTSKNTAALLLTAAAGSLLISQAQAIIVQESSVTNADFSDSFAGRNLLAADVNVVEGGTSANSDLDYFTFQSLTPGTPFSLQINTVSNGSSYYGSFSVLEDSGTDIGSSIFTAPSSGPGMGTITGTVPVGGNLTVFANGTDFGEQSGGSYTASLTAVPEPTTITLAALAAAALAMGSRKRRQQS